jgi:DNA-binding IclR family transcriptional regulator
MKQAALILSELQLAPATSEEIADATGVPQSSVAAILVSLRAIGAVARFGDGQSSRGRRMTIWSIPATSAPGEEVR